MLNRLIGWFYTSVCTYPLRWVLLSFAQGFAAGYFWRDLHQFLKTFTLMAMAATFVVLGAGNQWASAADPYCLTPDARYFDLTKHDERGADGLTSTSEYVCNHGPTIVKRDYDLFDNGKDDYTTYTLEGEDHPFAELTGDPDGHFDYAVVNGKRFDTMQHLQNEYPSVCEALRMRKG